MKIQRWNSICVLAGLLLAMAGCARRELVDLDRNPIGSHNTVNPVTRPESPASPVSSPAGTTSPSSSTRVSSPSTPLDLSPQPGGKTVELKTKDGVAIVGTWYEPKGSDQPALILLHMLGGTRNDWNAIAPQLQEAGYGVLSIDLRGHGVSVMRGRSMISWQRFSPADFGNMTLDVAAAEGFIQSRKNVARDQLAIVGASIGANVGLSYAAHHPEVKAVVLLSPGLDYRGVKAASAMKALGVRPVFMVASKEDKYSAASVEKLSQLSSAPPGKKKVELLTHSGHGTTLLVVRPQLVKELISFLQQALTSPQAAKQAR